MVAQQVGLDVGEFIWSGGDCHVHDRASITRRRERDFEQVRQHPPEQV
jgi:thymidylate synthase